MQQTVTASDLSRLPAQHATPTELAQLRAQIVRLEAELALYAFQYGLTHEARRLLDARIQGIGSFNL